MSTPTPTTMRAITSRRYGGPEVLQEEELTVPTPKVGQVLIKVEATSLNALDWHLMTGTPLFLRAISGLRRPKRIVGGADVAGTVVGLGANVEDLAIGDAVFGMCERGGLGEYLVAEVSALTHKPDNVSFEDAAATPVAGLTAVQALRTHGKLLAGEHVLINGAAGGVGTFSVQVAKALGAVVTAVCSSRNVEMVRSLGADHVVDYENADFVSAGPIYDVMMDNVGNRSPAECLSVLKPEGRYVVVSGPKTNRALGPVPHIIHTAIRFLRASQSFHQFTASGNEDDLALLRDLLATGQVDPAIQRVVGLDGAAEALREIGTGHTRAKIVVKPRL